MTWVALMVLAAAGTLYFVHLHRRMDAMRAELETRIGNTASVLRARADRAQDHAETAQRRVEAIENFLANKAIQSRYPGIGELEFSEVQVSRDPARGTERYSGSVRMVA